MDYSSEVLADSPLLYLRLGTLTGTEADLGSGGHTLTYGVGTTRGNRSLVKNTGDFSTKFPTGSATSGHQADIDGITNKPFTVEYWAVWPDVSTWRTAVAQGAGGLGGWGAGVLNNVTGKLRFTIFGVADVTSSQTIVVDTLYYVVNIYKSDGSVDFYVNGAFVDNVAGGAIGASTQAFTIGATSGGGDQINGGEVDEVAIYAGALSATRINYHWLAGSQANVVHTFHGIPF